MRSGSLATLTGAMALMLAATGVNAAPLVYQGQLIDGGRAANGSYDLQLTPHRSPTGADALAAAITFEDVPVRNGQFRVEADFGAGVDAVAEPWLQVAVRDARESGAFSVIGTRQKAGLAPLIGQCWSTTGDSGAVDGTNFLGTTDAQPLELRVQGQKVARFESGAIQIGNPALPAVNVGIGTNAPTQKLDVTGNLRVSGAFMPNGIAGTAGQVLTSNGGATAPVWQNAPSAFTGGRFSVRYDNTTAQTAGSQTDNLFSTALDAPTSQSALISFFALDYNTNADVSIDIANHRFTFNRAGLYHLEGMVRYFVTSQQTQSAGLQANVGLRINGNAGLVFLMNQAIVENAGMVSTNNTYAANIPFETTRFFAAGTTVEIEAKIFNLDTNPALIAIGVSRGGFFAGHFISD